MIHQATDRKTVLRFIASLCLIIGSLSFTHGAFAQAKGWPD